MQHETSPERIVGILLAAGRGRRFDASGVQDKLLQKLPGGDEVAVAAAKRLQAALPRVTAVVRPESEQLASRLRESGCSVTICAGAYEGMAASLVHALTAASDADGWVIALADMPYVAPATIRALTQAIADGAGIAAPVVNGRRGNPVAFGRRHLADLQQLQGDQGARRILEAHPVTQIDVDDEGVLRDIDTPEDLRSTP